MLRCALLRMSEVTEIPCEWGRLLSDRSGHRINEAAFSLGNFVLLKLGIRARGFCALQIDWENLGSFDSWAI